jgi:ERCC4-related helicase
VALTATPGNNEDKIQEVLENLNVARLEAKDENDHEVKPYVQSRAVTEVLIKETLAISDVNKMFNDLMMKPIKVINNMNIFPADSKLTFTKPAEVNKLKLVKMLEEFNKNLDEFTMQIGMGKRLE